MNGCEKGRWRVDRVPRSRGNGEGSIYQRKGRRGWFAAVSVEGRRKVLHAGTRAEVARELARVLGQRDAGTLVVGKSPSMAEFLEQWLECVIQPNRAVWTWRGYRAAVRVHVVPELGAVRVDRLTPQHIVRLLNRMQEKGASPKTVNNVRALLRSALTTAVRWSLVSRNVASLTDARESERPDIKPFTPAEAKAFLQAVHGDRLEALYRVALTMGLRQGEVLGLRWLDVDFEGGTLHVGEQLHRVGGKLVRVPLKTVRSRRTLAVPKFVVESLTEHRRRQLAEQRSTKSWSDTGYIFTTIAGEPLEARTVLRWFRRILDEAGIRPVRFHDLRHSTATLLLVQGVAPRVVMEILGHSQIATTMNIYTAVVPELQREAAARMDDLLLAPDLERPVAAALLPRLH
jgi:integrase